MNINNRRHALALVVIAAAMTLLPRTVSAHCDALDGPVVKAAQGALDSGDVNHVLIWIAQESEPEIRAAFEQARTVRALGTSAQALADRYFFEIVVRLHRAGEGEPYTGLKPAGLDRGPAIPAADRALELGTPAAVAALLIGEIEAGLHAQFDAVAAARYFRPADVEAGRRFVRAYVEYLHYVERLHEAAKAGHGAHLHSTIK